jgi:2-keto-4-pentenoate hydratase
MSPEDARCGRDKVGRLIEPHYGRVAGYKAGLTNAAAQKIFNYSAPVRGVLFERMLGLMSCSSSRGGPGRPTRRRP